MDVPSLLPVDPGLSPLLLAAGRRGMQIPLRNRWREAEHREVAIGRRLRNVRIEIGWQEDPVVGRTLAGIDEASLGCWGGVSDRCRSWFDWVEHRRWVKAVTVSAGGE